MPTLEITRETRGWEQEIARRLEAGEVARVDFETPSMSPSEAAESLGVSRSAVQKWIEQGKIATTRKGTYHRIAVAEVERFSLERIKGIIDDDYDAIMADLFGTR